MNIGENISKIRKSRGWTQAELAKRINKDRSIVTKYENGAVKVSADMVLNLARAFKVPISKIFKDSKKSA